MPYSDILDQTDLLKSQFADFYRHAAKLKALNNYASASQFPHKHYLKLIGRCMKDGFLGQKESDFLGHLLEKYELSYLDWAYKTPWLKATIADMQKAKQKRSAQRGDPRQLDLFSDSPNAKALASNMIPNATKKVGQWISA